VQKRNNRQPGSCAGNGDHSDYGIVISGYCSDYHKIVLKTDSSGTLLWCKAIYDDTASNVFQSPPLTHEKFGVENLIETSDGGLAMINTTSYGITLTKFDASGNFACNSANENVTSTTISPVVATEPFAWASEAVTTLSPSQNRVAFPLIPSACSYSGPQAITENESIQQISIYPNPVYSSAILSIQSPAFSGTNTLQILDALGNIAIEKEFSGQTATVETANLAPGIYFCRIKNKQGFEGAGKIIVQQ
jgi:hypothetical protein